MTSVDDARAAPPGRLFVYNGGFLNRRIRRILSLAGYSLTTGRPGPEDRIAIWGQSPTAHRGQAIAARSDATLIRIEDAFLRSVRTGRDGAPPLGLLIDGRGVHFDSAQPSALEHLLAHHPLDDTGLLDRARDGIARMRLEHLSKYNAFDPESPCPEPGYVLLIDQTAGDASITRGAATATTFREMMVAAQLAHPGARLLIKTHPETAAGHRPGHFDPAPHGAALVGDPVSPWALLDGAIAVYTVSSQLGFEAILAGHRPHVFGQPWYAGWGLTEDANPVPRRTRRLTRPQLFAAAMLLAPTWYDPCRDRLTSFEGALDQLAAQARAWRADHRGHSAVGMRAWKRGSLRRFFADGPLRFDDDPARAVARNRPVLAWAGHVTEPLEIATARASLPLLRVEDGFLRSKGLGADLVPPLSLAVDDLGIYYDPRRESRLERLIAESIDLPPWALRRAERLIARLIATGVSKYNVGKATGLGLPDGHRILVPGQVEDDASIRLGTDEIRTNGALLRAVRAANPAAVLIYKPHPDVEAGLRDGAVSDTDIAQADVVARGMDAAALLSVVTEVWTMTSTLGFEALLRGLPVTCLGAPFYAGWGLTSDLGRVPPRRDARPSLPALVHAVLLAYPRYRDPISGLPCPAEVVIDRLASATDIRTPTALKALAKLQGWAMGLGPFWR